MYSIRILHVLFLYNAIIHCFTSHASLNAVNPDLANQRLEAVLMRVAHLDCRLIDVARLVVWQERDGLVDGTARLRHADGVSGVKHRLRLVQLIIGVVE